MDSAWVWQILYTKIGTYFGLRNEIIAKMNTVWDGTITKIKYKHILHKSAFSFTLKIITKVFHTPYGTLIH
jgi:predicted kinase